MSSHLHIDSAAHTMRSVPTTGVTAAEAVRSWATITLELSAAMSLIAVQNYARRDTDAIF